MNSCTNSRFNFLGLNFHSVTLKDAMDRIEYFIETKTAHTVFTTGAELVVRANKSQGLKDIYNNADLLVIDSFIPYYAARLLRRPIKEPVNAARLLISFLDIIHKKGYRMYLLGAKDDSVNKAVENLKGRYKEINIVGWHHGYFDFENDAEVVKDIKEKRPDILFVAMSSPLKENFIAKNARNLQVPVCMGIGGSVDILSGKCRLAPIWLSRSGLEWLYRFTQEPRRLWKRYLTTNFIFAWLVLKELLGYEKNSPC
jgi:N-acetylglucosaminyldiphosphoundecaprenol N-acetyl-beta-D-mannosaminyltransferase